MDHFEMVQIEQQGILDKNFFIKSEFLLNSQFFPEPNKFFD